MESWVEFHKFPTTAKGVTFRLLVPLSHLRNGVAQKQFLGFSSPLLVSLASPPYTHSLRNARTRPTLLSFISHTKRSLHHRALLEHVYILFSPHYV